MSSLLTSLSDVISDDPLCLSSLSSLGLIPLILTSLTEAHLRNDQILGAIGPFLSSVVLHPVGVQLLQRAQPQKLDPSSWRLAALTAGEGGGDENEEGRGVSVGDEQVGKGERRRQQTTKKKIRDLEEESTGGKQENRERRRRALSQDHNEGKIDGHDDAGEGRGEEDVVGDMDERGPRKEGGERRRRRHVWNEEEYNSLLKQGLRVTGHTLEVQREAHHLQKTVEKNESSSSLFQQNDEDKDGEGAQWGVCGLLMSAAAAPEAVLLDRFGESAAGTEADGLPPWKPVAPEVAEEMVDTLKQPRPLSLDDLK
ncbi:hect-domain (ubiquitin-transferase) domain-containing protein, partial [Cystoisospora suis]